MRSRAENQIGFDFEANTSDGETTEPKWEKGADGVRRRKIMVPLPRNGKMVMREVVETHPDDQEKGKINRRNFDYRTYNS